MQWRRPYAEACWRACERRVGRRLTPTARDLYGLVRAAVRAGFPGITLRWADLAEKLGRDRVTIWRALVLLEQVGLVRPVQQFVLTPWTCVATRRAHRARQMASAYVLGPAALIPVAVKAPTQPPCRAASHTRQIATPSSLSLAGERERYSRSAPSRRQTLSPNAKPVSHRGAESPLATASGVLTNPSRGGELGAVAAWQELERKQGAEKAVARHGSAASAREAREAALRAHCAASVAREREAGAASADAADGPEAQRSELEILLEQSLELVTPTPEEEV